jgi:molybdopterin/thiamine biosynthesis adenylyltransferase/nitroreductase
MGGVGGVHLITMARTGVGRFHLADFDNYEPANINRQFGAQVPDFGRPKLEVMVESALNINPFLKIKEFPEGINLKNMDDFLEGVDVVLDGLDFFCFEIRRLLFNRAREKGIHVVTAGPMGFSSAMLIFSPHTGMSFDEYFNITEKMAPPDTYLAFALGLAPRPTHIKYMDLSRVDLESKAGPSLNIACQICSGMAATEAVRIILKKGKVKPVPWYFQFDPYLQKYRKGKLLMGNRNPIQRLKMQAVKILLRKKKRKQVPVVASTPKAAIAGKTIPHEVISYLVSMGTLATSADNCQPWRFQWDGKSLLLLKDPERTGFFYDVNNESTLMTMGAVIENIRIAATHYGIETSIELLPSACDDADKVARIRFLSTDLEEDQIFSFVGERCVNRKPYRRENIEEDIPRQLKEEVARTPGGDMEWLEEENAKNTMKEIIFDADRILFEDHRLHGGLFKWVRLRKEEMLKMDGMGLDVLELNWFQRQVFPLISYWSILSPLNKIGVSRVIANNSIVLLNRSPAYCLLTIAKRSPAAYIHGGMMIERFWIKANALGLSVQPMAGPIFLLNHFHHDGAIEFKENHRRMIQGIHEKLQSVLKEKKDKIPIMFFRLGYAQPPSARSPRRKVVEVLKIIT